VINQESLTLATITFQNYFRLYIKLSGMTGTAMTEAEEFGKIYNLGVIDIPTHRKMVRIDLPDRIYKTEDGKFRAVAKEVAVYHAKGQPVLIGTVSIQKNELLSNYLNQLKIPHQVLNAKNNETEAETVSAAGKRGAVTLATNIAGRGTDIMLEDGVAELGGLVVVGTERHESRRIDNQLRGRAGRQGDAGLSQFYVSLEDDLMRIFGGDRMQSMLTSLGLDDETPIENKLVSRSLEGAQKKVEGANFDTRKHLVDYDDVMNRHREVIYARRRKALASESLREDIIQSIRNQVEAMRVAHTNASTTELDIEHFRASVDSILPVSDEMADTLKRAHATEVVDMVGDEATRLYDERQEAFGPEVMRGVERFTYVNALDRLWIEHLEAMDSLRNGIGLRAYGQRDPLVEYKREGFRMFKQLIGLLEAEVATTIFKVSVQFHDHAQADAPVETALTRAAELATTSGGDESLIGTSPSVSRAVPTRPKNVRNDVSRPVTRRDEKFEHSMELTAQIEGVSYYDDSFASTPLTAIAAIRSFTEPKVIILGGWDKGADFAGLAKVVENEGVIHAFLIGNTAPAIEQSLRAAGFNHITAGYESMEKLVRNCYAVTEPGDVVLLSTGCASSGLFRDYKDRGNQFKVAVGRLQEASNAGN